MKDESASASAALLPETELWLPPAGWTRKEYELDREGRTAEADEWALAGTDSVRGLGLCQAVP